MNLFEQIITLLFHVGRLMIIYCLSYFKLTMKFIQNIRVLKASLVYFFNILVPIVCAAICSKVIFRLGLLKTTDKNHSTMKPTMQWMDALLSIQCHFTYIRGKHRRNFCHQVHLECHFTQVDALQSERLIILWWWEWRHTYIRIYYL